MPLFVVTLANANGFKSFFSCCIQVRTEEGAVKSTASSQLCCHTTLQISISAVQLMQNITMRSNDVGNSSTVLRNNRFDKNKASNMVPTGQGKLEKVREFEWSGKGRENFFLKSQGKRKMVPPDVRFSG